MSVRKAKKLLKREQDYILKDKKFIWIKWMSKGKYFLCDTAWGQRYKILL